MKMKLLSEFGNEENKSLLISLPNEMLKSLEVDGDDNVNTLSLLQLLNKKYLAENRHVTFEEHVDLMDMIFNSDRAVADPFRRKD